MTRCLWRSLSIILIVCMWPSVLCNGWAPKSKTDLQDAISECDDCSEGPHGPIGSWDVLAVTDMSYLFYNNFFQAKKFTGDISTWDVSRVTTMAYMFYSETSFDGDISKWDVSSVTDMSAMFIYASSFNGDISKWDVSRVTNMKQMFAQAPSFNGDLSKWDVSSVTDMSHMFESVSSFNGDISKWDVSRVTDMNNMFSSVPWFNSDVSKWDVSSVTTMNHMFFEAESFNSDVSTWDVSSVTDMTFMFTSATSFNSDISKWDVSRVTKMTVMFEHATLFNSDISKWDVSSVTNMNRMFYRAKSFNQKLCGANWVESKASKNDMFIQSSATISRTKCGFTSITELKDAVDTCLKLSPIGNCPNSPNGLIAEWDVLGVRLMTQMFMDATSFNGDISKWDVSSATSTSYMFMNAISFNADISKWDVSRATSMSQMFMRATSFKADVSKWDVSSVTDMSGMFRQAKVFNHDLSEWDVSRVTDMDDMFLDASSFTQELCGANWVNNWVNSQVRKNRMFTGSSGSISHTACKSAPTQATQSQYMKAFHISRGLDRELIARKPISTPSVTSTLDRTITCPRCGTFRKSGRVSCCAPGGAWFKNCGGLGSKSVYHRWSDGVKACTPVPAVMTTTIRSVCLKCGNIKKSGKSSCCGRGGSWFRNCGSAGNTKVRHTWHEGIQVCTTPAQSKRASGRQSNAAQRLNFSNGADTRNSKAVMTATAFALTSFNTPIPIPSRTRSITPAMKQSKSTSEGEANFKTMTMIPTTISSTSTNTSITSTPKTTTMLIITTVHTSTLTTTTTTTKAPTIAPKALVAQTAEEAIITTDWILQDSVLIGAIFACVFLLILIVFVVTICYFFRKNVTVKKRVPVVHSSP